MLERLSESARMCERRRFGGRRLTLDRVFRRCATSFPSFRMLTSKPFPLVEMRYRCRYNGSTVSPHKKGKLIRDPEAFRAHLSLCWGQTCKCASAAPCSNRTCINRQTWVIIIPSSRAMSLAVAGLVWNSRRGSRSSASVAGLGSSWSAVPE